MPICPRRLKDRPGGYGPSDARSIRAGDTVTVPSSLTTRSPIRITISVCGTRGAPGLGVRSVSLLAMSAIKYLNHVYNV